MKIKMICFQITAAAVLLLMRPVLCAATPLETKTAPFPELLEYVMKGITNKARFLSLDDKQQEKYILIVTDYSADRQPTNSSVLYMPWRLLQKIGTNNFYRLIGAGNSVEFTMSITNGNPQQKYGMPSSGFPRGSTNWLASMDVQLWANKELGDCDDVLHLHPESGDTNFIVLTAKAGGKWIILETRTDLQYAGYFDRGDTSYIPNSRNDPNKGPSPNAPRPMAWDAASKFEDFYGKAEVITTELGKVRFWRKGDFIVWHIDETPKRLVVAVEKVGGGDFNQAEVFEVAERYCGKQEWSLDEKDGRWTIYSAKDHKFSLTWTHKDIRNAKDAANLRERVSMQYFPVSEQLKKL
jgi:hypothetical protein